ncbi:MAG: MoaD/ThiS family protein [Labilithrix sp.]|nr:MoaD/ThiS family protein [Labilithrix sp.]MCW5816352.1 MoaD/ThiS family protein [Labilithrix sp.]
MITILYFAAVRELVGLDEEKVEFTGTITELATFLEGRHERLRGRLGAVRFAKNEEFAASEERIGPGDVIALVPPVAGG